MKKTLIAIMLAVSMMQMPAAVQAKKISSMGLMKISYYCPCEICSEGYGRKTATQTCAEAGRTVAVDPDVIALGTKLLIDGEEYIAEDVGGHVRGEHVDIFVDTHDETIEKGIKYKDVKIIRKCKK